MGHKTTASRKYNFKHEFQSPDKNALWIISPMISHILLCDTIVPPSRNLDDQKKIYLFIFLP